MMGVALCCNMNTTCNTYPSYDVSPFNIKVVTSNSQFLRNDLPKDGGYMRP